MSKKPEIKPVKAWAVYDADSGRLCDSPYSKVAIFPARGAARDASFGFENTSGKDYTVRRVWILPCEDWELSDG